MSFIEEHFDAEVAILLGIGSVIWGLLRFIDSQQKEHLKQWLERIEKNVNEMRLELKDIAENLVCPEQIAKMDDEISALQKEINLVREKSISVERIAKMDSEFQGLRTAIQKTREAMIQAATKEKEDLRRTEESLVRIEKKVDSKMDEKTCNFIRDKK